MAEIRTNYTKEQIAEYLRANNLDVLNSFQIGAKLMEIEMHIEHLYNQNLRPLELTKKIPEPSFSTANEDHN